MWDFDRLPLVSNAAVLTRSHHEEMLCFTRAGINFFFSPVEAVCCRWGRSTQAKPLMSYYGFALMPVWDPDQTSSVCMTMAGARLSPIKLYCVPPLYTLSSNRRPHGRGTSAGLALGVGGGWGWRGVSCPKMARISCSTPTRDCVMERALDFFTPRVRRFTVTLPPAEMSCVVRFYWP